MDIVFDYEKLRHRIKEVLGTQDRFAEEIGIGRVSLSQSLNNKREFSTGEIIRGAKALNISEGDIQDYFFTVKVQKSEPTM